MRYGYARVSTDSQSLDLQVQRLWASGCDKVVEEKRSGKTLERRDRLDCLLAVVSSGDEIVCVKIDRLARSLRDVLNIVHGLAARGVVLRILEPEVSTSGPVGNLVLTIFAMVGELELSIMRERQAAGVARAKAAGKFKGRKRSIDQARVQELRAAGTGATRIAEEIGASRSSVYRLMATETPALMATETPALMAKSADHDRQLPA